MRKSALLLLAVITVAILAIPQIGDAKPERTRCNPDGVAFEVIGCIHNLNVDEWEKLHKHYAKYLDSLFDKCRQDNPGGGSGGFDDRVRCAMKALEEEAKRTGLPK